MLFIVIFMLGKFLSTFTDNILITCNLMNSGSIIFNKCVFSCYYFIGEISVTNLGKLLMIDYCVVCMLTAVM